MATSILSRKLDLLYLIYFLVHLPIMFRKALTFLMSFPLSFYQFWFETAIRSIPANIQTSAEPSEIFISKYPSIISREFYNQFARSQPDFDVYLHALPHHLLVHLLPSFRHTLLLNTTTPSDHLFFNYLLTEIVIDLSSLYPPYLKTPATQVLVAYSKTHYRDYLLVPREGESAPAFFLLFMWMEVFYQVPVAVWAIWGLIKDHHKVPLVLILYAFQTVLTTLTCIVEYCSWNDITLQEKLDLTTLYGPYMLLATLMFVDMTVRLNGLIDRATVGKTVGVVEGKKTL